LVKRGPGWLVGTDEGATCPAGLGGGKLL